MPIIYNLKENIIGKILALIYRDMYNIINIVKKLSYTFLNQKTFDYKIEQLLFDSRQLLSPSMTLFFALKTSKNDGHKFITDLYQKGVKNFVISTPIDLEPYQGANFILVENVVEALQKIVQFHRNQFKLPVIGITGSNGKTIVKEWLFQLLEKDYKIVRSPKSYNSQIGVPMSVWQLRKEHQLGIFEAGISTSGEMEYIAPIINCSLGIFTNIGTAHDEGFKDRKSKIREKAILFKNAKTILYNQDNEEIREILTVFYPKKEHLTWSFKDKKADLYIKSVSSREKKQYGSLIKAIFYKKKIEIEIPFTDTASIENVLHCWLYLLYLGYDNTLLSRRMQLLQNVAMRLEMKKGINNCLLVNDSYNSDLTSLSVAINFLTQNSHQQNKTVILSDILQSGMDENKLYHAIAGILQKNKVDQLIGIGEKITRLESILPAFMSSFFYKSTTKFLQNIDKHYFNNEAILIKGARTFGFEKIANRLEEKIHKTILEINLSAFIHNLNVYKTFIKKETQIMVMVKAAAYGSGSVEIAKLLETQQVDYLAVAYIDEGIELRQAGIKLPIMVLNSDENSFETLLRYDLEPEIYSLRMLGSLIMFLKTIPHKTIKIHLKIDTGMKRLGFEQAEVVPLVSILLKNTQQIKVESIFSHLAGSEEVQHDAFTRNQIDLFKKIYKSISNALSYFPTSHILNSSGIIRFPNAQMDMVRLGIGLYGYDSTTLIQKKLLSISTLKATISQIKTLEKGQTIGYSRRGKANTKTIIATLSIGYADGLNRACGNGRFSVLLHHKKAKTIGNICMDMCMIDITNIPEAQEGDSVLIFGKSQGIEILAECMDTIPYEVLTSIPPRVKRVYFLE